jgi:hypothetical protein
MCSFITNLRVKHTGNGADKRESHCHPKRATVRVKPQLGASLLGLNLPDYGSRQPDLYKTKSRGEPLDLLKGQHPITPRRGIATAET